MWLGTGEVSGTGTAADMSNFATRIGVCQNAIQNFAFQLARNASGLLYMATPKHFGATETPNFGLNNTEVDISPEIGHISGSSGAVDIARSESHFVTNFESLEISLISVCLEQFRCMLYADTDI